MVLGPGNDVAAVGSFDRLDGFFGWNMKPPRSQVMISHSVESPLRIDTLSR